MSAINDRKTERLERLCAARYLPGLALALTHRHYLGWRLFGGEVRLKKAYHAAVSALERFPSVPELHFTRILLEIEMGELSAARERLQVFKPYRNAFKAEAWELYGYMTFLACLLEIRDGKSRAANKAYKAMEGFAEGKELAALKLALAWLNLEFGEHSEAYGYLTAVGESGTNMYLFYVLLYDLLYMEEGLEAVKEGQGALLTPFTRWAAAQGVDIAPLLRDYQEEYAAQLSKDMPLARRVYGLCPSGWLLELICRACINDYDYSETAYYYYREAAAKQIYPPMLNDVLVRAAFRNGVEELNRYALHACLDDDNLPVDIKPFVYYILLNDPACDDLADRYANRILQFGYYCLENKLKGRYYYSVYRFMLERGGASAASLTVLADMLSSLLFTCEIDVANPEIKSVWVHEPAKKEGAAYAVTGKTVRVQASSDEFSCVFLAGGARGAVSATFKARRLLGRTGEGLLRRFFDKGLRSPELLIALSRHYMSEDAVEERAVPVLEQVAVEAAVSADFRGRAMAALGDYYANRGDYGRACSYYRKAGGNGLEAEAAERMLTAYVNAGDYGRAAGLILRKGDYVPDRTLFFALKRLAPERKYHRALASAACRLILKSWHDKALLDIVLESYVGSRRDWQALSRALATANTADDELDGRILENAVRVRDRGAGAQRIFARLASRNGEWPAAARRYAVYMCFEIIINSFAPERETAEVMESAFENGGDTFIGYALCHLYIRHGLVTPRAPGITRRAAENCESDGFVFPVLKEVRDKSILPPYIEKNRPFIYRSAPGKRVELLCRPKGEEEYARIPARYVRFGLYAAHAVHFSGETLEYFFRESISSGDIATKTAEVVNNGARLLENSGDMYYIINNALIYEQMFKYDRVEEIINDRLKERPRLLGWVN